MMQKRRDERFRDAAEVRRTLQMHVYFQSISIFELENMSESGEKRNKGIAHCIFIFGVCTRKETKQTNNKLS